MTQNEFVKVTEELDKMANDILMGKGKEYADDFDRLANFKDIGKKFAIDPRVVLWVYLEKHLRSLSSSIVTGKASVESHTRIADCINYLKLLYALEYEMAGEDADENVIKSQQFVRRHGSGPLTSGIGAGRKSFTNEVMQEGTRAHEEISQLVTKLIVATDTIPLQKRNNWFYTVIQELQKQIDFNKTLEAKVAKDELRFTGLTEIRTTIGKDNNDKPMHGSELIR